MSFCSLLAPLDFSACSTLVWSDCMSNTVARRIASASSRTSTGFAVAPPWGQMLRANASHSTRMGSTFGEDEFSQPHQPPHVYARIPCGSTRIPSRCNPASNPC